MSKDHLKGILENRFIGSTPRILIQYVWRENQNFIFLTGPQGKGLWVEKMRKSSTEESSWVVSKCKCELKGTVLHVLVNRVYAKLERWERAHWILEIIMNYYESGWLQVWLEQMGVKRRLTWICKKCIKAWGLSGLRMRGQWEVWLKPEIETMLLPGTVTLSNELWI